MDRINKKYILDQFQEHLNQCYKNYCERHNTEFKIEHFTRYLIDQNLLDASTIRRYTIIREYKSLKHNSPSAKTDKVRLLADRFHLSERSVWAVLKGNDRSSIWLKED